MTGFVMFIHAFLAILMVAIILMQSGRGGGLTGGFASAESMFGAKTNEFMIKATTVIATLFFLTCLGLAILSSQKGKSLMFDQAAPETQATVTQAVDAVTKEVNTETVTDETMTVPIAESPADSLPDDAPIMGTDPETE